MKTERVLEILNKIEKVTVAVCGDFSLDAYWLLDPRGGEISVETGLHARAVHRHYYSLGGASNIVANLAAMRPKSIDAIGVIGDDVFGRELVRQLNGLRVNTSGLVVQKENFDTVTFGKPYLEDNEQARMDFGFFNNRSPETDEVILRHLRKALKTVDVVVFNQQVPGSLCNDSFICKVNELLDEFKERIVFLDSRHYGERFTNVYRKTNAVEAAQLNGVKADHGDVIAMESTMQHVQELYRRSGRAVFITRGHRGIIVADAEGVHEIPGIQLMKKLDTVGCGDTALSMLSLCMAAGVSPVESAMMANFAAAVTAQKLFQTGTADPDEILAIAADPDYIYQPELAKDIRKAVYFKDAEIEICCQTPPQLANVRHAVFDHDGTISTLRQGWEQIMEPVMVKAILGERYKTADETLYYRVVNRVREYIDKSTGVETFIQMAGLVEMVKEFGIVPAGRILDKFGYKKIYNDMLMDVVNRRVAKFQRGELNLDDFTVKGAVGFLKALRAKGICLYLASGTDNDDVRNEARILGYADLFDGGIYGALGDSNKYSKKMVIHRIINENKLDGSQLAVFGDGPVELRESRKRDGFAIGIASDEVQRYGLNPEKRTRLIKAGAHIIMPDFSQTVCFQKFFEA
jgi:bifunctional ADP-heptose synthase (sugar kinase/adenylyltransferase)/phosphoglycolate phosphatase-like HAD superfamily hydrolase